MHKRSSLAIASLVLLIFVAVPALAGDAPVQRFGARVKAKKSVDISQLAQSPERFKGKTVRLEGVVKDVCQGRGCWIEVADASGVSFLARSLDESVLVPKDCRGYKVVVQGVVTALPQKVRDEKPEGHTCPKPDYVVATQGVELVPAQK